MKITSSEGDVRNAAGRSRRRWTQWLRVTEIDKDMLRLCRHALGRLRLEGTALRNEATADLKGALRADWETREKLWTARTVEALRKVDHGEAEWFVCGERAGAAEGPIHGRISNDAVVVHAVRLQRLNEVLFEMWGD